MKKSTLLKQFEYSILPSAIALIGRKKNYVVAEHLPLLNIVIDFEHGNLKLEGDWNFMMTSNKFYESRWFDHHMERVHIETDILSSSVINLSDSANEGFAFSLEGIVRDGNYITAFPGLLILENVRGLNGRITEQWNLTLYLSDLQFNGCEIKFELPIYIKRGNEDKN